MGSGGEAMAERKGVLLVCDFETDDWWKAWECPGDAPRTYAANTLGTPSKGRWPSRIRPSRSGLAPYGFIFQTCTSDLSPSPRNSNT